MAARVHVVLIAAFLINIGGCAGLTSNGRNEISSDPLNAMLNQGLAQLRANIERSDNRLKELSAIMGTIDPTIQELRSLDLSGWELHRQQWMLQRDHLQYAKDLLGRVQDHPDQKGTALAEWLEHESHYHQALSEFTTQRATLEKQRVSVEDQLIEDRFR